MSSEVGLSRLVDPGAEDAEHDQNEGGDRQHDSRVPQQDTRSLP